MIKSEFKNLSEYKRKLICFEKVLEMYKNSNLDARDFLIDYYYEIKDVMNDILEKSFYSSIVPYIVNTETIGKNLETYETILENYYSVLIKYSNLAKELNLKTSLELCNYLSLLLYGGYFSIYGKHNYEFSNRYLINGLYSLDVVNGCGVCLNYADLLKDFLMVSNYHSSSLICKIPKDGLKLDYHLKINRTLDEGVVSDESKKEKFKKNLFENIMLMISNKWKSHAVNLIKDNEKLYIYDPANIAVFNIENFEKANLIGGIGYIKLMPIESLKVSPNFDSCHLFQYLDNYDFQNAGYERDEFFNSIEKVIQILSDNLVLIIDCYKEIYDDLVTISNYMHQVSDDQKTLKKKH